MKSQIVADGDFRLHQSEEFQERLRKLRQTIQARYAEELKTAGFWRSLILNWKIAAEFRRERQLIKPSPASLYSSSSEPVTQGQDRD